LIRGQFRLDALSKPGIGQHHFGIWALFDFDLFVQMINETPSNQSMKPRPPTQ
jgi:hypothetical protein